MSRYEDGVRSLNAGAGKGQAKPRTLGAAAAVYLASPEYKGLGKDRRDRLRQCLDPIVETHGEKRMNRMKRRDFRAIHNEVADKYSSANQRVCVLRRLCEVAIELGWRTDNPACGIKMLSAPPGGHHTWSEWEINQYVATHLPGTLAHTVMTLMISTGASIIDVVRLGWANIQGGRVIYQRSKTSRSGGPTISIPILPDLAVLLDQLPKDATTFLQTSEGKQRSHNALGDLMRNWCNAAGLPRCTSHGLRKALACRVAEGGATAHQIAAWTGHKTISEVERYTRAAKRAKLADDGLKAIRKARRSRS